MQHEEPTINREHDNEQNPQLSVGAEIEAKIEHNDGAHGDDPSINIPREEPTQTLGAQAEGTESQEAANSGSSDQQPANEPAVETPATDWSPDWKYKVRDQEFEMDDWAKSAVKDEDTYKKVLDLYTRGHGLEIAKQERDQFKNAYTDLEASVNHVANISKEYYQDPTNPQHVASVARRFINALDLPPQMFLQYAIDEVNYRNLPQEQRQAIDMQRKMEADQVQLQQQNQQLQEQQGSMQSQHFSQLLDYKLADPTVAPMVQQYEQRVGKPGAFTELVVQRGIYHEKMNGSTITPDQAVSEVIQLLGITPGGTQTQNSVQAGTQVTQPQQNQTSQGTVPGKKPVLPNISGQSGASPVKRTYTSLEQIRKRKAELLAQQGMA